MSTALLGGCFFEDESPEPPPCRTCDPDPDPDPQPDPDPDPDPDIPFTPPNRLYLANTDRGTAVGGIHTIKTMTGTFLLADYDEPYVTTIDGPLELVDLDPPLITVRGVAPGEATVWLRNPNSGVAFARIDLPVRTVDSASALDVWQSGVENSVTISLVSDDGIELVDEATVIDAGATGGEPTSWETVDLGPMPIGTVSVTATASDGIERPVAIDFAANPDSITGESISLFGIEAQGDTFEAGTVGTFYMFTAHLGERNFRGGKFTYVAPPELSIISVPDPEGLAAIRSEEVGEYTLTVENGAASAQFLFTAVEPEPSP